MAISKTRVYFLRHAESDRSVRDGRIRPLTEAGRRAADALIGVFEKIALDAVYSSPFKRAVDTVAPLAARRALPIVTVEGLRERLSDSDAIADWPSFFMRQWADFSHTLSDGECLAAVQARNIRALEGILQAEAGRSIAIGTHGTALSTIIHYYVSDFGYEDFMRMLPVMPYVVRMDFEGTAFCGMKALFPSPD